MDTDEIIRCLKMARRIIETCPPKPDFRDDYEGNTYTPAGIACAINLTIKEYERQLKKDESILGVTCDDNDNKITIESCPYCKTISYVNNFCPKCGTHLY